MSGREQTGSQALSDPAPRCLSETANRRFNPKREARPSQTPFLPRPFRGGKISFNPKREARPSQTGTNSNENGSPFLFQSQTGSQALSDVVRQIRILLAVIRFQSQTGSQALSDFAQVAILVIGSRFNPKREARPSQTPLVRAVAGRRQCFNPKREARPSQTRTFRSSPSTWGTFQSQTGSQALSDLEEIGIPYSFYSVSIPNGKPGPLRLKPVGLLHRQKRSVSIPNGKPGPLRPRLLRAPPGRTDRFNPKREARPSQTSGLLRGSTLLARFNPKREARPSQTVRFVLAGRSYPGFNPKREARPSQTEFTKERCALRNNVSIPNGKPGPLRREIHGMYAEGWGMFQSQTGSQALSDYWSQPFARRPVYRFQSQTGSQALSDLAPKPLDKSVCTVSIPNGKPGPLRRVLLDD